MNSRGVTPRRIRRSTIAPALVLALSSPVMGGVLDKPASPDGGVWHIRQIPLSGDWYHGWVEFRRLTPLDRGIRYRHGFHAIYTAYVIPGGEYALGLRYRAGEKAKVHVMVFDRWPFDAKARRYDLPMGPVVRTDREVVEYRWRIGISRRSPGSRLFIVVEAEPPVGREAVRFRHSIYLVGSPRRPKDLLGRGITYLRGPSDLRLAEIPADRQIVFVEPLGYGPVGAGMWRPDRNLVRNGDFHLGLDGWEFVSERGPDEAMRHVAVGDRGLRLWGGADPVRSGVRQLIQRHVADAPSLLLSATVMIENGGKSPADSGAVPLAVSVCYVDIKDAEHCGPDAYRKNFTTAASGKRGELTVRLVEGEWYEFEEDLTDLAPPPSVIRSISIEGGGVEDAEAWVRGVSLATR